MTVEELYRQMIDAWNKHDAEGFGSLLVLDGEAVGFDGTQHTGRGTITEQLRAIFATHSPPSYTAKIVGVTTVTTDVAIVRAVAGMIPAGKTEFDPKLHAVMRLTAVHRGGDWRIALLQSTPAQFHGRADEIAKLTAELAAP